MIEDLVLPTRKIYYSIVDGTFLLLVIVIEDLVLPTRKIYYSILDVGSNIFFIVPRGNTHSVTSISHSSPAVT